MEVTNFSPCNFTVQCTNKQHNPPFITWPYFLRPNWMWGEIPAKQNHMWLGVVFFLSQTRRNAQPWWVSFFLYFVLFLFCERVCVLSRRGWEVEEFIMEVSSYEKWLQPRGHTPPWARLSLARLGGWSSRVYDVCVGGVDRGWGVGGNRSDSRGRYCVARLAVRAGVLCPLWPHTPPHSQRGFTGWQDSLSALSKHVCSNVASELHRDFQFACKGMKLNVLSRDKQQTTMEEEVSINTEFICNTGYMSFFFWWHMQTNL